MFPVHLSKLQSLDGFLREDSDSITSVCPVLHPTRRSISLEAFSFCNPTRSGDLVFFVQTLQQSFLFRRLCAKIRLDREVVDCVS